MIVLKISNIDLPYVCFNNRRLLNMETIFYVFTSYYNNFKSFTMESMRSAGAGPIPIHVTVFDSI